MNFLFVDSNISGPNKWKVCVPVAPQLSLFSPLKIRLDYMPIIFCWNVTSLGATCQKQLNMTYDIYFGYFYLFY